MRQIAEFVFASRSNNAAASAYFPLSMSAAASCSRAGREALACGAARGTTMPAARRTTDSRQIIRFSLGLLHATCQGVLTVVIRLAQLLPQRKTRAANRTANGPDSRRMPRSNKPQPMAGETLIDRQQTDRATRNPRIPVRARAYKPASSPALRSSVIWRIYSGRPIRGGCAPSGSGRTRASRGCDGN